MEWIIVGIVILFILIVNLPGIFQGKSSRSQSSGFTDSGSGPSFWSGDSHSGSDGCSDSSGSSDGGGGGGDGGGCD